MAVEALTPAGLRVLDARIAALSERVRRWCEGYQGPCDPYGRLVEHPIDALELIDEYLLERFERA